MLRNFAGDPVALLWVEGEWTAGSVQDIFLINEDGASAGSVRFFVLCNRHRFNRVPGSGLGPNGVESRP